MFLHVSMGISSYSILCGCKALFPEETKNTSMAQDLAMKSHGRTYLKDVRNPGAISYI